MRERRSLPQQMLAEMIGTYILVFFGVGSVHVAVLTGALVGLWQVAIVWGVGISLAIYAVGAVSGAHINPAITVAFAALRRFPLRRVGPYVGAQLVGAFLAAATLHALFAGAIDHFEGAHGIVRGQSGSELSAMVYGEYFPNPAVARAAAWPDEVVSHWQAMLGEGLGTAFLAFFVFAVTERRNRNRPGGRMGALFIGLTVSIIISVIAPLTQAGLNPARDLGPRLFALAAGWKQIAIPGPRGGFFTVYVLSPLLGAVTGAAAYHYLVGLALPAAGRSRPQAPQAEKTHMAKKVRIILLGGFLGAGKTTLMARAAGRLVQQGKRVGLITNDQAEDLVDTEILKAAGFGVQEIAGGCFCCRFENLISSSDTLIERLDPDVLLGEPVGSCTDLSATVLQPLKKFHGDRFQVAPFAVLADPSRLQEVFRGGADGSLPDSVTYIFRKQLEEADLIVINKADLLTAAQRRQVVADARQHFPGRPVLTLSAKTGEGVDDLLERLMADAPAGQRVPQVDYDTYAEGEAMLGWLNGTVRLQAAGAVDWADYCRSLLEAIRDRLAAEGAEIAHLKVLLITTGGTLAGNLTRTAAEPAVRSELTAATADAVLVINARVNQPPDALQVVVRDALQTVRGGALGVQVRKMVALRPGRPQPVHRFNAAV
jgi:MIP family channel proteins